MTDAATITLGLDEWMRLYELARSSDCPEDVRAAAERAAMSARTVRLAPLVFNVPASSAAILSPVGLTFGLAPSPPPVAPPEPRLRLVPPADSSAE